MYYFHSLWLSVAMLTVSLCYMLFYTRGDDHYGCSSADHGVNLDLAKEELSKLQKINNGILCQLVSLYHDLWKWNILGSYKNCAIKISLDMYSIYYFCTSMMAPRVFWQGHSFKLSVPDANADVIFKHFK